MARGGVADAGVTLKREPARARELESWLTLSLDPPRSGWDDRNGELVHADCYGTLRWIPARAREGYASCVKSTQTERGNLQKAAKKTVAPAMLDYRAFSGGIVKLPSKTGRAGMTLVEVLAVIAIVAVVAVFLLPPLMSEARAKAARVYCANHLGQIGVAFKLWAGDHNDAFPMQVSVTNGGTMDLVEKGIANVHIQVLSNEFGSPRVLVCPADRNRRPAPDFGSGFGNRNLSYFVGLDARLNSPQMLLSGDDDLAVGGAPAKSGILQLWTNMPVAWEPQVHLYGGNVVFADGSVQGLTTSRLQDAVSATGVTNRLAMP